MPIIESRPLRIIAAELEARERSERSGSLRFDYAALARRTRAKPSQIETHARDDGPFGGAQDGTAADRWSIFGAPDSGDDPHESDAAALALECGDREYKKHDIPERISRSTLPVVDAMYQTQGHVLKLAATLANEVASFCGDPSITASGNWNVQLPLDSQIVPDTVLYLSLSPFHLSLRFDTQSARSRQLLLDHSTLLQRELDSLLRAWGAARDIEVTVW